MRSTRGAVAAGLTCLAAFAKALATECDSEPLLPYRDATLPVDERVDDLMSRMSLLDKAGQMYHQRYVSYQPGSYDTLVNLIHTAHMSHFLYMGGVTDVDAFVDSYNSIQKQAVENTTLGIPITLSTDPQHGWLQDDITANAGAAFSRWPEPMGLAAIRDPDLAWQYGDAIRQELNAVGLRHVLSPQVDLFTEPRWGRGGAALGEDAELTSSLMLRILNGLQGGKTITNTSILSTVKHFPGGGAQEHGLDPHTPEGQFQVYPANNEAYHLKPFEAAIEAGAPQMMPYYSRPKGNEWDSVGFSFSKKVIKELLQTTMGYKGVVLTDFGIVSLFSWGVEDRSVPEKTQLIIEAGCDQIGGESSPEIIVKLVEDGELTEDRIDVSVRKLLEQKFRLGLFEKPFINTDEAKKVLAKPEFVEAASEAQRRSFTLLTNQNHTLPLKRSKSMKVYAEGVPRASLEAYGLKIVAKPSDADVAFLRLSSPREPAQPGDLAASIGKGTLEFNGTEKARQSAIFSQVPTIVDIRADRPPAVPEIAENAAALFLSYGSSPEAFLDVVFGVAEPHGKLPFDMPRSDKAVEASLEDLEFDTEDPVFEFGHGLRYRAKPCKPRHKARV